MTTEAKVGAFVLGCFSILAFTLIYLMDAEFSRDTVPYRTYLRYAGGLEPGASVLFGGINVGKVKAVQPWSSDPTKIEILLDVTKNTPLNEKSVAKLGLVSVMSEAALSITTGSNDAKRLAPGSSIPSQEAASLDEIAGKMATVADNANGLITQTRGELGDITRDARILLANLNTVTGKPNQQKIQAVLDNVNGMLANERPKIDRLTDQLNTLAQHADATVQNVNGTVTDAREPLRKDLTELQTTLQQAKALLTDIQVTVRANDYKIDDTVENLRTVTDNLDQLTDSLKQRPWSMIRIRQPKEREVPQQKCGGFETESDRNFLCFNNSDHSVWLRRRGEVSKLLHPTCSTATRSTGAGKPTCDSGCPRIPLTRILASGRHCVQDVSRANRVLQLSPLGDRSAGFCNQRRG